MSDTLVHDILVAVSTVLLTLSSGVLFVIWSEIIRLRRKSHDHATLLSAHDVLLGIHDKDIDAIKERIFNDGG